MSDLDISPFLEAKSDQITADDLIGGPRTFRVARVEMPGGEQPVLVHLEGMDGKPFKPCKGMRRLLAAMWGLDAAKWAGRSVTLFRDPDVRFGADQTGGVRVAAVSHIDETKTLPIRVSRGKAKQYKVEPLHDAPKQERPEKPSAEEWAARYIDSVRGCSSIEDLIAVQTKEAKGLTKLKEDRPDLHERASEEGAKKAAALQGEDA